MATFTSFQVPFPSSCALNKERLSPLPDTSIPTSIPKIQENETQSITHIPGDPAVYLQLNEVRAYVSDQLGTPLLDELYDQLWLVARRSGQNIDALHKQRVKGRSIVPTEDPRLHLIWDGDKVYVKPVPVFLLNHDFWTLYLQPQIQEASSPSYLGLPPTAPLAYERSVAIGFLRSYALLVPHRLDFIFAKEYYLIPEDIDWLQWSRFIHKFRHLEDEIVAKRYHYGQLRLSRLNWAVRIFRPQHASTMWFYEIPHWSITKFVTRATLPLLFVFASVSLVLSAMQIAVSVPADGLWSQGLLEPGLKEMHRAFWVFSIFTVLASVFIWSLFLGIPLLGLIWQLQWGFRNREKQHLIDGN